VAADADYDLARKAGHYSFEPGQGVDSAWETVAAVAAADIEIVGIAAADIETVGTDYVAVDTEPVAYTEAEAVADADAVADTVATDFHRVEWRTTASDQEVADIAAVDTGYANIGAAAEAPRSG